MTSHTPDLEGLAVHVEGPWPFITRRHYERADRTIEWLARQHRKGLNLWARALDDIPQPFWRSAGYNWGIGATFAVGAFLFMLGSVMSLVPASPWQPSVFWTNIVFFAGSIPFTLAAYMQHFQAANATAFEGAAGGEVSTRVFFIGWHPRSPGWISTFTQLIGTVAFNFNTFDSIKAPAGWLMEDLAVWTPDMLGSILFLVSGYLAFIECGHRYWSWHPKDLSWQIVFVNLAGCIAFMTAAILAYVPDGPEAAWIVTVSTVHLLIGATCFFIGACMTMRESAYT